MRKQYVMLTTLLLHFLILSTFSTGAHAESNAEFVSLLSGDVEEVLIEELSDDSALISWRKEQTQDGEWNVSISRSKLPGINRMIANCGSSGTVAFVNPDGEWGMTLHFLDLRSGKDRLFRLTANPEVDSEAVQSEIGYGLENMELICNKDASKLVVAIRSTFEYSHNRITYLSIDINAGKFARLGTFDDLTHYFGGRRMNPDFSSIFVGEGNTEPYEAVSLIPIPIKIVEYKDTKYQYCYFENEVFNVLRFGDRSQTNDKPLRKSNLISMTQYNTDGRKANSRCEIETNKVVHAQPAINGVLLTVSQPQKQNRFRPVIATPGKDGAACELHNIGDWQKSPFSGVGPYDFHDAYSDVGMGVIRASHPKEALGGEEITTQFSLLRKDEIEQPLIGVVHEFKGIQEETGMSWEALDRPSESEAIFVHGISDIDGFLVYFWKRRFIDKER